jgi:hypothetical protein
MDLIDDIAYNACSFVWNPRVAAKVWNLIGLLNDVMDESQEIFLCFVC